MFTPGRATSPEKGPRSTTLTAKRSQNPEMIQKNPFDIKKEKLREKARINKEKTQRRRELLLQEEK